MNDQGCLGEHLYVLRSQEEKLRQNISEDPLVALVDTLLYTAIKLGASDIHIQPEESVARVRYRIDGILYDQVPLPYEQYQMIVSRLKVFSSLDIAQTRIPQDGKIRVAVYKKAGKVLPSDVSLIDLRISTFPSIYGEKMVVRILDRSHNVFDAKSIGLATAVYNTIKILTEKPQGFFLVTGPTGSGKSTTLYTLLSLLNKPDKNIVTMEDPVEYDIKGITQSQVNALSGFTFESGLRCLLRQDPDIIMIGEIRDKATVHIAIEAALTGHLVFSTLHTNDAAGAITRLLDMGVEPFLINATLSCVLAQRLARMLCQKCKKEVTPTDYAKKIAERYHCTLNHMFTAQGCAHCHNIGYRGRIGIFEFLVLDDVIRELIMKNASCEKIRAQAVESGMATLAQDGIAKINDGVFSLEEFLCIVGE